jgi:ligand-binding SRPBCC domain-containing protein
MGKTFTLRDAVVVEAPVERCFRLSTSIEVVALTLEMRPVEGKLGGMILAGDQLVWRGWKFGLPQMHETLITGYREPRDGQPGFFQDTMGRGRFQAFQHDHHFMETEGGTLLEDELRFSMPFGWAGEMVGRVVMVPHIRGLLRRRFALLKRLAEGEGWRAYLESEASTVRAGQAAGQGAGQG